MKAPRCLIRILIIFAFFIQGFYAIDSEALTEDQQYRLSMGESIDDPEMDYDPINTMLALNACIVSTAKIISYNDRIVLNQEYSDIINNINFSNVKDDDELVYLHRVLMSQITNAQLREEEKDRYLKAYNKKTKRALYESLSGISVQGMSPAGLIVNGLTSVGSAYFSYKNTIDSYREELDNQMWVLEKEKIIGLNVIQEELLEASWRLIQRYNLPDEYRLNNNQVNEFMKIVKDEKDLEKRFRKLKRMEESFKAYPPYWYYYGITAQNSGKNEIAIEAYNKFEEVRRDVIRIDPYYASICMNKIRLLNFNKDHEEIVRCLKIIEKHSQNADWTNYLILSMHHYSLRNLIKAQNLLQRNIDNGYEIELHEELLTKIKSGKGIDEGVRRTILISMLNKDSLKNQDLLQLYGKVKDEILLNRISTDISDIRLLINKKGMRKDELKILLPQKWVMGIYGHEQDNVFYLKNMTDDFKLSVYIDGNKQLSKYTKEDLVLKSDNKKEMKERLKEAENKLKSYEETDGDGSVSDINNKHKMTVKSKEKIEKIENRNKNLKAKNIKFYKNEKLFEFTFHGEIDDYGQNNLSVIIEHPIYAVTIDFKEVIEVESFLERHPSIKWFAHPIWGTVSSLSKDSHFFAPNELSFNSRYYIIEDNKIKENPYRVGIFTGKQN